MITEISIEYELIDYMVTYRSKYFNFDILATEVKFKYRLKSVDMLGETKFNYIIIEFKREDITEEDFYNIRYIIDNNKYDKPIRGILVGTGIDDKLLEKIRLGDNEDIEILIPDGVKYKKSNSKEKNKKVYKIKENKRAKFLKMLFYNTKGYENIDIKYNDNKQVIKYKIHNEREIRVIFNNDICSIDVFKKYDDMDNRYWYVDNCKNIRFHEIDNLVFNIENENYINSIKTEENFLEYNYNYVTSIGLLSKYIDIKNYPYKLSKNTIKLDSESGIRLYKSYRNNGYHIFPLKYSYNMFKEVKKNHIYDIEEYNYFNILESTRIIIGNDIYRTVNEVIPEGHNSKLKLFIKLSNGKIITKLYGITKINQAINSELYLIANIDIIVDFELYVKSYIKNGIKIDEKYKDFIGTYKYSKMKKRKLNTIKYIRNVIENLTESDKEFIDFNKGYY